MTYKQTLTIQKDWSNAGGARFTPAGLFVRLLRTLKLEIPVGYQDETGFHTGVQPEEDQIKWPPVE